MASEPVHVVVSGISGFIGSRIAHDLLSRGYHVHGTVRRNDEDAVAHLTSCEYPGSLSIFEADLNQPSSFDAAVTGCKYAIHVAAPPHVTTGHVKKDFVNPIVDGTLNFLTSCAASRVHKVVMTSSFNTIAHGGVKGHVFIEECWNTQSTLRFQPYYYAKTKAEREARKFAKANNLNLVAINPVSVYGPSLVPRLNVSSEFLVKLIRGEFQGIIDLEVSCTDVRDVSEAHIRAMLDESAKERYICGPTRLVHLRELAEMAIQLGYDVPTRDMTGMTRIIKLSSHILPGGVEGQFIRTHLGNPPVLSNERICNDLKMNFRDPIDVFRETFLDLIKRGHIPAPTPDFDTDAIDT